MKPFKDFRDIILQERTQLTPEMERYLANHVFTRKPIGWIDVDKISKKKMPSDVRDWVNSLKMITWKDLMGGERPKKGEEFYPDRPGIGNDGTFVVSATPQYFIAKAGAKKFLIDTQGYNYVRYAAQIVA